MHHTVRGRHRRGVPGRRTGRRRDRLPPLRLRRARARTPPHLCRSWPEARWCGQGSDATVTLACRPGRQYVLFVAEANRDAQAFYQRHGLVVERKVEGGSHLAIGIKVVGPPPPAPAVVMRYAASTT